MALAFPFDPLKRSEEVENQVTKENQRLYYRFRPAPYYGGIATADAVGCSFLCAYCWNYNRNLYPEKFKKFYSSQQVADKLLHIARRKSFRLFRISGAEPVLGENSFFHLIEVLRLINQSKPSSLFILETNGFYLGYRTDILEKFQEFSNLRVRVCIKGVDEDSFAKITGAIKDFYRFPLIALRELEGLGIKAWPALMGDLFSREKISKFESSLIENGIRSELELEFLETYPFVLENMKERKIRVI
ncbi:MAG: 4Fe-4S cluster-binding domain-containing protein [Candidatus Aminicenantes bacterium]|nr:MAG: 4Fe-4S cluster-binding domain-containing protein [Candidatus Aminicenantes bacterium]